MIMKKEKIKWRKIWEDEKTSVKTEIENMGRKKKDFKKLKMIWRKIWEAEKTSVKTEKENMGRKKKR